MNSKRIKTIIQWILLIIIVAGIWYVNNQKEESNITENSVSTTYDTKSPAPSAKPAKNILGLTDEKIVIRYLQEHGALPDYYITKNQARALGWIASKGNLCEVLPGRAIGGDVFGNREGHLPKSKNRKYYEADLNYDCGTRNADRVVFSNDGLIFITKDHYNSFYEPSN